MPQTLGPVRQLAVQLRQQYPNMTLLSIADECGVTKQRIFAILKSEGLPTRGKYAKRHFRFCKNCGLLNDKPYPFCSDGCRDKHIFIAMTCRACGQKFKTQRKDINYKLKNGQYNFYCTKECSRFGRRQKLI